MKKKSLQKLAGILAISPIALISIACGNTKETNPVTPPPVVKDPIQEKKTAELKQKLLNLATKLNELKNDKYIVNNKINVNVNSIDDLIVQINELKNKETINDEQYNEVKKWSDVYEQRINNEKQKYLDSLKVRYKALLNDVKQYQNEISKQTNDELSKFILSQEQIDNETDYEVFENLIVKLNSLKQKINDEVLLIIKEKNNLIEQNKKIIDQINELIKEPYQSQDLIILRDEIIKSINNLTSLNVNSSSLDQLQIVKLSLNSQLQSAQDYKAEVEKRKQSLAIYSELEVLTKQIETLKNKLSLETNNKFNALVRRYQDDYNHKNINELIQDKESLTVLLQKAKEEAKEYDKRQLEIKKFITLNSQLLEELKALKQLNRLSDEQNNKIVQAEKDSNQAINSNDLDLLKANNKNLENLIDEIQKQLNIINDNNERYINQLISEINTYKNEVTQLINSANGNDLSNDLKSEVSSVLSTLDKHISARNKEVLLSDKNTLEQLINKINSAIEQYNEQQRQHLIQLAKIKNNIINLINQLKANDVQSVLQQEEKNKFAELESSFNQNNSNWDLNQLQNTYNELIKLHTIAQNRITKKNQEEQARRELINSKITHLSSILQEINNYDLSNINHESFQIINKYIEKSNNDIATGNLVGLQEDIAKSDEIKALIQQELNNYAEFGKQRDKLISQIDQLIAQKDSLITQNLIQENTNNKLTNTITPFLSKDITPDNISTIQSNIQNANNLLIKANKQYELLNKINTFKSEVNALLAYYEPIKQQGNSLINRYIKQIDDENSILEITQLEQIEKSFDSTVANFKNNTIKYYDSQRTNILSELIINKNQAEQYKNTLSNNYSEQISKIDQIITELENNNTNLTNDQISEKITVFANKLLGFQREIQVIKQGDSLYEDKYNKLNATLTRLQALPSTKIDGANYKTQIPYLPTEYVNLNNQQKSTGLQNLETLINTVNTTYPENIIKLKEDAQQNISVLLDERVTNRNDMYYDLNVKSISINNKNFDLYLRQKNKSNNIQINSKELKLNSNDFNDLEVKYNITRDNVSTYILKNVKFDAKTQDIINRINQSNIEDLFNFNYSYFTHFYKEDFIKNINTNLNNVFNKKFRNLEWNFDYDIEPNTYSLTDDNKITFNVIISFKGQFIKRLTLTGKQPVVFKERNILAEQTKITYKWDLTRQKEWQNNQSNGLIKLISEDVWYIAIKDSDNSSVKSFNYESESDWNYIQQTWEAPWNKNKYTYAEKVKFLTKLLNKYLNISLPEGYNKWEIINLDKDYIFKYDDRKRTATFKIKITGQKRPEYNYNLEIKTKDADEIIQNDQKWWALRDYLNNYQEILSHLIVNNPELTHTLFIASEGVKKLNEMYSLPKYKDYDIVFLNQNPSDYSVDDINGFVNIKLAAMKDGKVLSDWRAKGKEFRLNYFKPRTYRDVKPINGEWFTAEDFKTTGHNKEISDMVKGLNANNFEYRLSWGKRVFDADAIMREKSYDKINYILKLKASKSDKSKDDEKNNGFNNDQNSYGDEHLGKEGPKIEETPIIDKDTLVPRNTPTNNIDGSRLNNDFYMYFYDVRFTRQTTQYEYDETTGQYKQVPKTIEMFDPRNMSWTMIFKVGFIYKKDLNERYTSGDITLINLKNDMFKDFYPNVILNRVQKSEIRLDYQVDNFNPYANNILKSKETTLPSEFVKDYNTNKNNNPWKVSVRTPSYKRINLNPNGFYIKDVAKPDDKNGRLLIRLAYKEPVRQGINNNKEFVGDVWYVIDGFKTNNQANEVDYSDHVLLSTLKFNESMKKVYKSNGKVIRLRTNETTQKDNYWKASADKNSVHYTLKNDYFKPVLEQNNTYAKVKLHLSANIRFLDNYTYGRVFEGLTTGKEGGLDFEFNYKELKDNGKLVIKRKTDEFDSKTGKVSVAYTLIITLIDEGMHFEFKLDNPNYKIIQEKAITELYKQPYFDVPNELQNTFDPEKAFFFDYFAGRITYEYENDIANEDFGNANTTNIISYKYMSFTQENVPIVLYNQDSLTDPFKYNPNQMLSYKLHDGYKFDNEYLHDAYRNSAIGKDLVSRAFATTYGSGMMVAKVNKDPNDGRFYIFTNHHVIASDSTQNNPEDSQDGRWTYETVSGLNFENEIDKGFSYWNPPYNVEAPAKIIWSGINQTKTGSRRDETTDLHNDVILKGQHFDVTVAIIDVNKIIDKQLRYGNIYVAQWYKNWFNLKDLKLSDFLLIQSLNRNKNIQHGLFNGFPFGKQAGYIIHRMSNGYNVDGFWAQTSYIPSFYNQGNSGTGVMNDTGDYISTINSGTPLKYLVGQKGAFDNGIESANYYGINKEGQDPLSLINNHSLARNIMRLNAFAPNTYEIPWFFKEFIKSEK
ncbi:MGA_1079 family surface serine endopeptidase [Mycoplasmopsis verecunda]|uniref:DNA repair exonuclease SbcCD ATPase subunit n=1 Tax=Mycoplasmopsis verecunda TaxID=171291 RepID=A0A1T4KGG2_9BACT|nr:hypothetical protein [Mycoplasmopsis verecunda]WPB54235.1 hypothetical protein SAM46_01985 [Mycoplasmopsis verecunda]SJZ41491.1 DNA repair exonuclease SbcCD ATPase subunit [Mycoplasmopsis verecunda]